MQVTSSLVPIERIEQSTQKLKDLENKYDIKFKAVFEAIRQLMTPSEKPKRKN